MYLDDSLGFHPVEERSGSIFSGIRAISIDFFLGYGFKSADTDYVSVNILKLLFNCKDTAEALVFFLD